VQPRFFETQADFRRWLSRHHNTTTELWVGFRKKATGRRSVTYPEALDEALCVGWIDGVRRRVDDESYTIRFTPRKPVSIWSRVNIRKIDVLIEAGRMKQPGLAAFERRSPDTQVRYSYENQPAQLAPAYERLFKATPAAWTFFRSQAPWYQRTSIFWVMSAVREQTRARRLATLIADSAKGRRLAQLDNRRAASSSRSRRRQMKR
jgi:uncharacterized protein YdeI (YjbR/CyaY-like superfamily)